MAVKEYVPSNLNHETKNTHEPSPELIAAVDEVFTKQVSALESLPIDPEVEAGIGAWVKCAVPNDRTKGTLSE